MKRKLVAHCQGLAQIRMTKLGKITLEEKFSWTPNQLLTIIKEIDKICPEEGLTNIPANGNQQRNEGNEMISE
jgi:hypothetical protein